MRGAREDSVPPEGFITPHSRQILAQHFYTPRTDMLHEQNIVTIVYRVYTPCSHMLYE